MTAACRCPKVDVSIYRPRQGARHVPGAVDARCEVHGSVAARFSPHPAHHQPATTTTVEELS